jgi:predicted LPLAT superfamily acyltransferase
VLHPITLYFVLFAPAPRRHSRRYLTRALGRAAGWRDVYRHFFTFTATVLDRVYLLGGCMDLFDLNVHGEALIDATLAEGRGAFLVGAHAGSFEVLRAVGQSRTGLRIAMVMYPDNARLINQALRAIAPHDEPQIIALGRRDSMLAVRDWLDGGGLAGLLGDRALPGESRRAGSIRVDFLGREASFSDGPFRLAALLRRRVVFMTGLYAGGNRYDVRFQALADFSQRAADSAERERHIREAVFAYAARLEAVCHEQPYNWFNFHDFWREDAT